MFLFTNKKVTNIWNSEVESMKKISKIASREQLADVLLLVLELDMSWSR